VSAVFIGPVRVFLFASINRMRWSWALLQRCSWVTELFLNLVHGLISGHPSFVLLIYCTDLSILRGAWLVRHHHSNLVSVPTLKQHPWPSAKIAATHVVYLGGQLTKS
jgi:hypothetical protein